MSEDRQPAETHEPETPSATEADPTAQTANESAEAPAAEVAAAESAPKADAAVASADETTVKADAPAEAKTTEPDAPKAAAPASTVEEDEEQLESKKRAEFGAMLDQFESTKSVGDEVEVGTKVKGRIIQLGDDTSFIDFGGRSEGAVETQHLKAEDGSLKYAVGDEIRNIDWKLYAKSDRYYVKQFEDKA